MPTIKLSRRAMNCEFELIVSGEDKQYLEDVAFHVLEEVRRMDDQLSCFNPTSEISFINVEAARRPVIVDPNLFKLLQLAKKVWRDTDGAFDITLGPVIDLWRTSERTGEPPDNLSLKNALQRVGMEHIVLDETDNSVRFTREGIGINLGAIGKGYAVRQAAAILIEHGIQSALIHGGRSTIYAIGSQPGSNGWRIGIRHPSKLDERVYSITLQDQALSTSGGVEQKDEHVVERFEHIIDPSTSMPVEPLVVSANVIADDPALSDALSTAFYLKGRKLAETYRASHEGIEVVFIEKGPESEYQAVHIF